MPPLFTAAQFSGVARPSPVGVTPFNPAGASNAVNLSLSDGSTVQLCDALETALRLMEWMRTRNQWMIQASDDVIVCSISATKLLFLEAGLIQQKLLAGFAPVYIGGKVMFQHRTMSQLLSFSDAAESVGFARLSAAQWQGNFDLSTAPSIHALLVDWYFLANVSSSTQGSQLSDGTPIVYDYT